MKNSFFLVIPKQQSNPQRLREFEEKYLQQWIAALPAANPGLSTRLIYDLILEMNALAMPAQLRLEGLELLRPNLLATEEFLRLKLLKSDFPKEISDHKALKLLVALQKQFTIGYWIIVKELTGTEIGWLKGKNAALAIQRCLRGLSSILISHYLMGMSAPDWLWLDLHGLYRLSVKTKTNAVQIKIGLDQHDTQKSASSEDSYLQIVLLSLASPVGLMQKEIFQVYNFCGGLRYLVKIKSQPIANQLMQCLALVEEDKPPCFSDRLDPAKREEISVNPALAWYFDFTKLYQAIAAEKLAVTNSQARFATRHEIADAKNQINEELLAYLQQRWSGVALQSDDLFADRLDRYIAIGLSASYKLQQKAKAEQPPESVEYLARSVSGQLLSGVLDKPNVLSVGSLVSIRIADMSVHKRILGVVNQLTVEKEKFQVNFGIQLLASQYLAVDYRCKLEGGKYERHGYALLCKRQDGKNFLIMDNFLFKEGDTLSLLVNQDNLTVLLKNKTNIALGYWQFECVRLVEQGVHH